LQNLANKKYPYASDFPTQKGHRMMSFQTVEKVQKSLGFFFILWYNNIGNER